MSGTAGGNVAKEVAKEVLDNAAPALSKSDNVKSFPLKNADDFVDGVNKSGSNLLSEGAEQMGRGGTEIQPGNPWYNTFTAKTGAVVLGVLAVVGLTPFLAKLGSQVGGATLFPGLPTEYSGAMSCSLSLSFSCSCCLALMIIMISILPSMV
jgi:hypothetical protein